MKCIVTAGPTFEPLDEVRRLTNFSTGTLGVGLANQLTQQGHTVVLLLGHYAVCQQPSTARTQQIFTTTEDLSQRLQALAAEPVDAVFHAAAVNDFAFGRVWQRGQQGDLRPVQAAKIPSDLPGLLAELAPTPKVIRRLRGWFPQALLVGWKYELEGTPAEAMARAERQLAECHTDACVLNGRAYGAGFGLVRGPNSCQHLEDPPMLYAALAELLQSHR